MGLGRGSGFSDGKITIGTQVDTYGINQGLAKIQKTFKSLQYLSGGILSGFGLIKLGKQALSAASDLAEVQNIVDVSFEDMEYKIEEFSKICIDKFGMSEVAAKQTAGSFMAMGKASGIATDEASDMAIKLTALTGDMSSFYNIRQEYARVALSAVYTGETETLKRYGIILTEANLQEYASTQGIKTKVKAMSARDKAMLRYNYILQATADIEGDFLQTQSTWANQTRVLEEVWNQFLITVGSGLITVLSPARKWLNMFIRYLTAWANKIGHILAKLLGIQWQDLADNVQGTGESIEGLTDDTDDLADGIGKATKAAKKALAPFDDLNVLTDNMSNSASGLATGLEMADFDLGDILGGGFEGEADFDIKLPDISSWFDLGKYFSDSLRNMLDNIDWDTIYQKAGAFGSGFASFLNGLIRPDTFHSVGVTIAGGLNTAIKAALDFGKVFSFTNFGLSLSEAINGFFEEWNAIDAAECINTWVQGFWTAIKAFFKGDAEGEGGLDWPLIKNKINDFFSNLDVETIALIVGAITISQVGKWLFGGAAIAALEKAISTLITKKALPALGKVLSTKLLPAIGAFFSTKLFPAIGGFFTKILPGFFTKTIPTFFTTLWSTISTSLASMGGFEGMSSLSFSELFGAGTAGEIGTAMATEFISAVVAILGGSRIGISGGAILATLFEEAGLKGFSADAYEDYMDFGGVFTMFKDLGVAIKDVVTDTELAKKTFSSWGADIKEFFLGENSAIGNWIQDWKDAIDIMKDEEWVIKLQEIGLKIYGPEGFWATLGTKTSETVENVKTFFTDLVESIKTKASTFIVQATAIFLMFKTDILTIFNSIKTFLITTFTNIKDTVTTTIETFKTTVEEKLNTFKTNIETSANTLKTNLTNLVSLIKTTIQTDVDSMKNNVSSKFTDLKSNIETTVTNIKNKIKEVFGNITEFISTKFNTWKTNTSEAVKTIKDTVINTFTNLKTSLVNIMNDLKNAIKIPINAVISFIEFMINTIISGINTLTSSLGTVSVTIPSWASKIPGFPEDLAGSTLGFSIPEISKVSIPRLAKGGVIPPNKEFMAVLGDQKHGTNIEAPLDTIVDAFKVAMGNSDSNMVVALLQQQIQLLQAIADKNLTITDKQVFDSVKRSTSDYVKRHGGTVPFGA